MYEPWQMIVQAGYGILLFPLYIFVLINFLISPFNKPFQSYFFKISTVLGFVDIVSYITVWIFVKLPACPLTYKLFLTSGNSYIFNILAFLRYFTNLARCYLMILSSANRFTALNFAFRHESLWKKYGKFFIIISLIISAGLTMEKLFGTLHAYILNEAVAIDALNDFWNQSFIFAFHTAITAIVTFTLNLFSLRAVMKQQKNVVSSKNIIHSNIENHKVERLLLIISFWDFIVDSLYTAVTAWQLYRSFVGRKTMDDTPYVLIIWILDLNNLFRPLILVLTCKALKQKLLKLLFGGFTTTVTPHTKISSIHRIVFVSKN